MVQAWLSIPLNIYAVLSSAPLLLPPREELKLGERTMAYLPRCADVNSDIRKTSAQVKAVINAFTVEGWNNLGWPKVTSFS